MDNTTPDPRTALARWLTGRIKERGISKEALAERSQIARSTIYAFTSVESNNILPAAKALSKILDALDADRQARDEAWDLWRDGWRSITRHAQADAGVGV